MLTDPFEDTPPTLDDIETGNYNVGSLGKGSAAQQGVNIPAGWKPTVAAPVPVVRCTGIVRQGPNTGQRCPKWSLRGATVCLSHGGHLPSVKEHAQAVVEAARMRMIGLTDDAIDAIEDLVSNPQTQAAVRLKAATEILDRAGIKGAPDLAITVEHTISASDTIAEKLKSMALRLTPKPEPLDLGEVVEEAEPPVDEEGPPVVS